MSEALSGEANELSAELLHSNFRFFSLLFGCSKAIVKTPLVVATSVLSLETGYFGNAILTVCTGASALVLGPSIVQTLGVKRALLLGSWSNAIYCALFSVSLFRGANDEVMQRLLFCTGSCIAGVSAGIMWCAQGQYFSFTADHIADRLKVERQQVTGSLSSTFAVPLLVTEVAANMGWALLSYLALDSWMIALLYTFIGASSMLLMMYRLHDLESPRSRVHWCSKCHTTIALWRDPTVFLLSGLNLTFGFSSAFLNGYVNANFTTKQLGAASPPMLAALVGLVAALLARAYGLIAALHGKFIVVLIGSLSFLSIPLCFLMLHCCEGWGRSLMFLYIAQASGRAVYESIWRSVFADFFPHNSIAAFSNCMLQSSVSLGLCFFLSDILGSALLVTITMSLSALTPMGFVLARHRHENKSARAHSASDVELTSASFVQAEEN